MGHGMGERRVCLTKDNMDNDIPFKIFRSRADGNLKKQGIHSHEYIQMWFVENGRCTHHLGNGKFEYMRFGLFIVPPFVEHAVDHETADSVLICCEFSERFINESLSRVDRDTLFDYSYLEPFFLYDDISEKGFKISSEKEIVVESLMLEMITRFEEKSKYSLLFIKANLLKLLAIIASESEREMRDGKERLIAKYQKDVEKATEYLEENYMKKIYLEEVCKQSLMSNSTFSYAFKQITEKTFSEYLMNIRLSKACEMLKKTKLSVLDVCHNCGFGDSTYFSRVFKSRIGLTPIQYRKQSRMD